MLTTVAKISTYIGTIAGGKITRTRTPELYVTRVISRDVALSANPRGRAFP